MAIRNVNQLKSDEVLIRQKLTQEHIVDWLSKLDSKYHLTITFRAGISDTVCLKHLNKFYKHLNQRVHHRKCVERKLWVEGIACAERTKQGELHFHCLLIEHHRELPSRNDLQRSVDSVVNSFKPASFVKNGSIVTPPKPFTEKGVCLQDYYDLGEHFLEKYITKSFNNPHSFTDDKTSFIGILGADRVDFGGDIGLAKY